MTAGLRSVSSVILGIVVGGVLVGLIEGVGHQFYPPPAGLDLNDRDAMAALIRSMPLGAFLSLLAAYAIGPLVGGWIAARLAGRAPMAHALAVGGVFLAASIGNLALIPHPAWFAAANLAVVAAATVLAGRLAGRGRPVTAPSVPVA